MVLSIDFVDGRALSNKAHRECLAKETKVKKYKTFISPIVYYNDSISPARWNASVIKVSGAIELRNMQHIAQ